MVAKPVKKLERTLASRAGFQLAIIALILAWTGLTVTEIAAGTGTAAASALNRLSAGIGVLFAVELFIRWSSSNSTSRFVREYWLDGVAILSVVPALATALPAIRLLRLLRLYRLIVLVRNVPAFGGFVRHRGPRRAVALLGIIALSVVVATAALLAFESDTNQELRTFDQAFWFSLYSIFATQPTPDAPITLGGRVVSLFLIFVGLSTFAVLTGTVSAVVLSRLKMEGIVVEWEDLKEHLIICGWNRKAEIIVAEYVATHRDDPMPVVVIAKLDGSPAFTEQALRGRVQFLDDDFTKVSAMEKAGIHRASTCILLSDTTRGRNERDADARTILAALTVERINPKVYTCAELNRREYSTHLKLGCVDDFVVNGEHSGFLLAQAAINHGTLSVWSELLSYEFGHKFCRIPVPQKLVGQTFTDALTLLKRDANVVAIAVVPKGGEPKINPGAVKLADGDELVVIADADYQA